MRLVVGITGASGAIYGVRLLEVLAGRAEVFLLVSEVGEMVLQHECDMSRDDLKGFVKEFFDVNDFMAPIASGSFKFDAMVIIPCSMKTLGMIANGIAHNLITRCADICLKEGRKLVVVPRETPLSAIHLENMLKLARLGVTILPASPGFYGRPKTVNELVDFVVGKVLDVLGIESALFERWGDEGMVG